MIATATDIENEFNKLEPLFPVLDRVMAIPTKLSFGLSQVEANNQLQPPPELPWRGETGLIGLKMISLGSSKPFVWNP